LQLHEHENAIASLVFKSGKAAGRFADDLRSSKGHYIPLKTSQGVFGVFGIFFDEDKLDLNLKES